MSKYNLDPEGVELYEPKPSPRDGRTEPDQYDFEATGLSAIDAKLQLVEEPIRAQAVNLRKAKHHFRTQTEAAFDAVGQASIEKSEAQRALARLETADEHASYIREAPVGATTDLDQFNRRRNKRLNGKDKPTVAEDASIAAARTRLERAIADKAKAEEARDAASKASHAAIKLVAEVERRIVRPEPMALVALPEPGEVSFDALGPIRVDINGAKKRIDALKRMARTTDEVRAHEHARIDERASSVRFDAHRSFTGLDGYWEENLGAAHGWSGTFNPHAVMCLLLGDQMKAVVDQAIDQAALEYDETIDAASRDAAIAEVTTRLDELERQEESLIRALEEQGHIVLRRGSASVAAVLSIAD